MGLLFGRLVGTTCRVEEPGRSKRAATNSGAVGTWEFHTTLLDSQTLDDGCTAESVLHDTLAVLASSQKAKRRSRRQKQILTLTPSCIYVNDSKSKSTAFVHDVGNVLQFEVAKENQTIFGYTTFSPTTERVQLLCFKVAKWTKRSVRINVEMEGLDVQAAYIAAYSMWVEAQAQEEREVEEQQTVISVEINTEDQAVDEEEEEEEEEWFDARDELDSQESDVEEDEWFDALDVFGAESTEAINTAGGLRQTPVQSQLEHNTIIQEVPVESRQRGNTLLKRVRMKLVRKKHPKPSPGKPPKRLAKKTSWLHKLCRSVCCVTPNSNSRASLPEEIQHTDTDGDTGDLMISTTVQDVPLVEGDTGSQCYESDDEANGSVSPMDMACSTITVQVEVHPCSPSEHQHLTNVIVA